MESFQKLSHNEQSEYSWWFMASHCEVFKFFYRSVKIFHDIMQTISFTWLDVLSFLFFFFFLNSGLVDVGVPFLP